MHRAHCLHWLWQCVYTSDHPSCIAVSRVRPVLEPYHLMRSSSGMCPGTAIGFFWALGGEIMFCSSKAGSWPLNSRGGTSRAISFLCRPWKIGTENCWDSRVKRREMVTDLLFWRMLFAHYSLKPVSATFLFHGLFIDFDRIPRSYFWNRFLDMTICTLRPISHVVRWL